MNNPLATKKDLTAQELSLLNSEYQKQKKGSTPMWLLWLFLGSIGGHRYYLGDICQGIFHTLMVVLAFILSSAWSAYVAETVSTIEDMMIHSSMGVLFFLVPLFFALLDAFFINRRLAKKNAAIEEKIIDQIKGMRPTTAPPAP
mgnify:CR=1 FL=1